MSSASRKVKNPLLSAAGEGFPFDSYAENALLVPVTPATPAVLPDDAEIDNFVGQEPANSHASTLPVSPTGGVAELTTVPLHSEDIKTPIEQPRQGYFTSILSSLPNLSLSSITGDNSVPPVSQSSENLGAIQKTNFDVPSHDRRSSLRDTPTLPAGNPYDPRQTILLRPGEVNTGITGNLSTPSQPVLPPTVPVSDGRVSYRLGNQRRLKYAPPPDLTLNTPKQYPAPTVQNFFTPQNVAAPPSILNPNESTPTIQNYPVDTPAPLIPPLVLRPATDQLSQGSALHESYRSSPVAAGNPYSSSGTPRSITPQSQSSYYDSVPLPAKFGIPVSSSRSIPTRVPEPATPQNTPANVSFTGFDLYASQRDFLATPNLDKEVAGIREATQISPQQILRDTGATSQGVNDPLADVTFTPISAVKISEKLEHLLAEQEERTSDLSSVAPAKVDENPPIETQAVEPVCDIKLNDTNDKIDLPKPDVLTDVFFGQQVSESIQPVDKSVTPQEPQTTTVKVFTPHSQAVPSNVQSFQQYYQPQPSFASSASFFEDKPAGQKSDLNAPSVEPPSILTSVPDNSRNQPARPFFDTSEHSGSFPFFQPKESNPNTHIDFVPTYSSFPQSRENSSFPPSSVGSAIPVPQTLWSTNQGPHTQTIDATCSATNQPPPPLFYNPTQLQSDLYNSPPAIPKYVPVQQSVNPSQPYFDNLLASKPVYDAADGNNTIFLPSSSMATVAPEPTGSATLSPVQMSVNPLSGRYTGDTVPPSLQNLASDSTDKRMQYRTVYHHWFYRKEVEHKVLWLSFSMQDSLRLEEAHNSSEITPETTVATDGGRYDVNILRRQRSPVYWTGTVTEVRRCSWFFKGPTESRYVPYDESTAAKLEEEYKQACLTNNWNRRIDLNNGEYIIFHSPTVHVHYSTPSSPELAASWGNSAVSEDSAYLQGVATRPRVIKRGFDEFHIEDGEPEKVDHLLFLVHGIGSVCDLKFRSVEEVVDEFRSISLQLVQSHYRTATEQRVVNRIEVLPISWHTTLHSEDTGIDKKLQAITLESIPKLRHFTNDTLLDILFYTSPIYCQTIMQTVGCEMNRLYALFKERNPEFDGGIYLGGHSLGSLILFDLLCHQKPLTEEKTEADDDGENDDENTKSAETLAPKVLKRRLSKKISYVMGSAGTGQPYIHYPQLNFHPRAFFALGSPIGMFVTVRGIDTLGDDFVLPTCPAFFNVFHPFDPVAYRVEALINPDAHKYRPMLIPHHKGRKRMHLELKETMARVGADLKQKLLDSVRNTWNSVYQLALFHKPDNQALEREIDKVVEEELQKTPTVPEQQNNDDGGADFKVGKLNGGRRIDYVLQEAPFEYINEYIFALTSHVCYWESEDTMLMILKEIYGSVGIQTDAQLPQQTMSIERASPSPSSLLSPSVASKGDIGSPIPVLGMDPTAPISEKLVGPPPKAGFVRKS